MLAPPDEVPMPPWTTHDRTFDGIDLGHRLRQPEQLGRREVGVHVAHRVEHAALDEPGPAGVGADLGLDRLEHDLLVRRAVEVAAGQRVPDPRVRHRVVAAQVDLPGREARAA